DWSVDTHGNMNLLSRFEAGKAGTGLSRARGDVGKAGANRTTCLHYPATPASPLDDALTKARDWISKKIAKRRALWISARMSHLSSRSTANTARPPTLGRGAWPLPPCSRTRSPG